MKRIYMAIITILCSIGIAISIAQAWFINGFDVDPLATGSSTEAYYHSGTGTQSDPYIITTPRHLYNLAWLQYLGTYNKDKKNGLNFPATYFKIGTSAGITIDMTDWPLPPIGTAKYPFIGNFNGNGATILNLTSTNNFTEFGDKHPSGVDNLNFEADYCGTVGFFGAIGAYNANIISESDSTNDNYTYDTANNKAYNFYLNNTSVHTCRSTTLIGTVAGYVNAKIEDVGVIQPHLNIQASASSKLASKTSNLSDFAVVGYAEEQYTTQKTKTSTIIYNPTYDYSHFNFKGMGSQAEWGGSIDMTSLYNRINAQINNTGLSQYINGEIQYNNITHTAVNTTSTPSNLHQYKSFSDGSGAYLTQNTAPYNGYDYLTALYKNVIKVTKEATTENGYTINCNGQYLNITSTRITNTLNFNVTVSYDSGDSTVWVEENNSGGVNLYTYNEDDGYKYYLVGNSDFSVSVSNQTPTIWHWNGNTYYTTINNVEYYLKYSYGEWTLKPTYTIGDGNGNYLKSDLTNTTNISEAGIWQVYSDGTIINEDEYILHFTNTGTRLTLSYDEWTEWDYNNGALSYNGYYIQFNGTSWVAALPLSFYIYYRDYYLTTNNGTSVSYSTAENSATVWTFEQNDGEPSGYIYTTIGNTNYYLYYNNGSLGITNNTSLRSEFNTNENGIYYDNNGTNYYLQYNSSWNFTATLNQYYITYQDDTIVHYLSLNGTNIIDTININDATLWTFSNPNGSGTIKSGNYYLYMQNGYSLLTASTTSSNWTLSDDGIYNNYGYIQFYNNKWICGRLISINFESNYLSVNNNSLANSEIPYDWVFSYYNTNGTRTLIYTIVNNNIYYLRYDNGLSFNTTASNNSWYINNNYQIYSYNSNNNFIQCINGIWTATTKNYAYIRSGSNHYLSNNGLELVDKTSLSEATLWRFSTASDTPSGTIHPTLDNVDMFIYNNSTTLNSTSRTWSINNGNRLRYRSGSSYYISYSNGWRTGTSTTGANLTWILPCGQVDSENGNHLASTKMLSNKITSSSKTSLTSRSVSTRTSDYINEYTREEGIEEPSVFNYIPLNTNNDYSVSESNTGYLMSGGHSGSSGSLSNVDIRLAGGETLYNISWGLSNSVNTNGTIKANSVYTYDSSGHHAINDTTNTYQKFKSSKSDLETTLVATVNAGNAVGGIHFITSLISMNRLVTAEKVLINGNYHTNYQMPENSFDFMLKKKGYINFFAGLYYPGNQSFFSLHKIERDSNDTIISIKNISKIYGSDNNRNPYVYLYSDGTYSDGYTAVPSGYTQIFDCVWIESPNITNWDVASYGSGYKNNGAYMKRLYYFEIPVNDGEYCLGSVNGLDGGYLMYLDIGANAAVVDRTTITQRSDVVTEDMIYASGIQILASGSIFTSDSNTCVAVVKNTNTGQINITRTGDTVSFGGTALDSTYWDEGLTVPNGTLNVNTSTSVMKVLKYIDYNNGTSTLYYATVIDVDATSTFEVREIDGDTNPLVVDSNSTSTELTSALYGLLKIGTGEDAGYGIQDTASNAISSHTFATTSKIVEYSYNIPTSVITNDGIDYSFDINVSQINQTGNVTIGSFTITDGTYTFSDGYTSTHCYKLNGDDITYVFTQIPVGTTTTAFKVTVKDGNYTVTINGTTISVGNYTYTFSTNTIASS